MLPADILCCGMSSFLAISPETVFYEQQQPISFADLWSSDGRAGLLSLLTTCLWQVYMLSESSFCVLHDEQSPLLGLYKRPYATLHACLCLANLSSSPVYRCSITHTGRFSMAARSGTTMSWD